ncbi:conserved protein, unknown function, partial [Hepatocystis sp. ex Piliocolobus tephrosceles]
EYYYDIFLNNNNNSNSNVKANNVCINSINDSICNNKQKKKEETNERCNLKQTIEKRYTFDIEQVQNNLVLLRNDKSYEELLYITMDECNKRIYNEINKIPCLFYNDSSSLDEYPDNQYNYSNNKNMNNMIIYSEGMGKHVPNISINSSSSINSNSNNFFNDNYYTSNNHLLHHKNNYELTNSRHTNIYTSSYTISSSSTLNKSDNNMSNEQNTNLTNYATNMLNHSNGEKLTNAYGTVGISTNDNMSGIIDQASIIQNAKNAKNAKKRLSFEDHKYSHKSVFDREISAHMAKDKKKKKMKNKKRDRK